MSVQKRALLGILTSLLKGLGQIMLQNNPWTGLCFLTGICCGSLMMGVAAIIGVIAGTLTAIVLRYEPEEISEGIYGFSAALVGVALIFYFHPTVMIWGLIVGGSVLATMIQHTFIKKRIPAFTFPFIIVTWFFIGFFYHFPALVYFRPISTDTCTQDYVVMLSHGFGQVIFQHNIWSGMLFATGVLISRPIAALYAVLGIALSSMAAYLLQEPVSDIYLGLLGYNAVLCAITFAGKKRGAVVLGLVSVILSVLIMVLLRQTGLPVLTFPFVLATWLTLIIKGMQRTISLKRSNE